MDVDRTKQPIAKEGGYQKTGESWLSVHRPLQLTAALILPLLTAQPLSAQTNDEINAGLQFDFSPPGARSLGIGRAFVGHADDATAAYANPAGLGLRAAYRTELSIEGRGWDFTTKYIDGGRFNGTPSNRGIDDGTRPLLTDFSSQAAGVSFFSLAYSPEKRYRWHFALFGHRLSHFSSEIDRSEGVFYTSSGLDLRDAAIRGALALDIEHFGAAVSYTLLRDSNLSIGLGVSWYAFELDAVTNRYGVLRVPQPDGSFRLSYEQISFSDDNISDTHFQQGRDNALGLSVGVLWRNKRDLLRIGAAYRYGPRFTFDYEFVYGLRRYLFLDAGGACRLDAGISRAACRSFDVDFVDPERAEILSGTTEFDVPDVTSVGLSWSPTASRRFRVFLEYARIEYSELQPRRNILQVLVDCVDPHGSVLSRTQRRGSSCSEAGGSWVSDEEQLKLFRIDDGNEIHLGLEYGLSLENRFKISKLAVVLRAGAWLDPDHQLHFEGESENLRARFYDGDDEVHLTTGIGLIIPDSFWQFDLAFDRSDRSKILSLSAVIGIERGFRESKHH